MTATTTGPTTAAPAARMTHPATVLPGAMDALLALGRAVEAGPVPHRTHKLVQLRASQINGCGLCVDLHARELRAADVGEEVVWAVAAWRESPRSLETRRPPRMAASSSGIASAMAILRPSGQPATVLPVPFRGGAAS